MFLTDDELADLTGRKRSKLQIEWLVDHGYKFELNAAGRPKVLRAFVERKLGGPPANSKGREPNLVPRLKEALNTRPTAKGQRS